MCPFFCKPYYTEKLLGQTHTAIGGYLNAVDGYVFMGAFSFFLLFFFYLLSTTHYLNWKGSLSKLDDTVADFYGAGRRFCIPRYGCDGGCFIRFSFFPCFLAHLHTHTHTHVLTSNNHLHRGLDRDDVVRWRHAGS